MSIRKDVKELTAVLTRFGGTVTIGSRHYKVVYDNKQVTFAASPSDRRAFLNIRRDIRVTFGLDIRDYGWTK